MKERIGFIGIGIMGQAMAANILKHGYALTIFNRTEEKTKALAKAGASVATSPAALTSACDTIILMLTGPEAVEAVLHGKQGILSADYEGKTIINMSTVPPEHSKKWSEELAAHGIIMIDAPVSGSKVPAEQGALVILAGGPQEAVQAQDQLLLTMGKKVIYCGPAGRGSSMKLAINLLLGIMMEGMAEAAHLAERSELTTEKLLEVIASGPLSCTLFQLKEEMFKTGNYPPQFPFKHMAKDMQFVMDAAKQSGAHLPVGRTLATLFSPDADNTLMDQDFAAVKTLLDKG